MVPLRFNFGDDHHVDKVTITSDEFWNELQTNPNHPQTSQPTPGDFQRQYQFLIGHYKNAISIHLPAAVSGTLQSAKLAAKSNKEIANRSYRLRKRFYWYWAYSHVCC